MVVEAEPALVVTSPVRAGKVATGKVANSSILPVPALDLPKITLDETVCILAKVTLLAPISGAVAVPLKSPAN